MLKIFPFASYFLPSVLSKARTFQLMGVLRRGGALCPELFSGLHCPNVSPSSWWGTRAQLHCWSPATRQFSTCPPCWEGSREGTLLALSRPTEKTRGGDSSKCTCPALKSSGGGRLQDWSNGFAVVLLWICRAWDTEWNQVSLSWPHSPQRLRRRKEKKKKLHLGPGVSRNLLLCLKLPG